MEWELKHVDDVEAALDDSGVYVVVHRVLEPMDRTETLQGHTMVHKGIVGPVRVRADLMGRSPDGINAAPVPIMSFIGTANAVRKALARYLEYYHGINHPSMEHMTYIGYELLRAETDPHFVQD